MRNPAPTLAISIVLACMAAFARPADGDVALGKHVLLIQGFEGADVLEKKPNVSYLSGVPEEAEVEVWDDALYRRKKIPHAESGIACKLSAAHKTQGKAALAAKFTRGDRWLRVSLRNNINQPDRADRPACNSIGCFDCLRGDVFNPGGEALTVEMRMLGGFAVTDRAATFSLERTLRLEPGWNSFAVTSREASATFVDPHDATCVEFRAPAGNGAVLHFDNFRMERETIGENMAKFARCFDFGVPHFNWPGFAYGSVKWDADRGYGFTKGERLTHGGDLHVINDQLTRDGFSAPASFRVRLPNGRYKVVTQTGDYWARRDGGLNIEIQAEGKRVYYRPKMSDREFLNFKYAHERADHGRRGLDLWGTYDEGTYFRTIRFEAEVADGALDLDFLLPPVADGRPHGWSVWTYLVVYPAEKEELIAPELNWLNEKIRTIYNTVSHAPISRQFALYNREEVICPEEFLFPDIAQARRKALSPTPAERGRGYVHFLRHQHDLITPDSVPRPGETGDRLAVFGTPGETVQFAVGLYPLEDLARVGVSLTDFIDEDTKRMILAQRGELRLASYRPMTPVTSNHAECFHYVGPGVLIRPEPIRIPKHYPRRWWVTVPIPKDCPPGRYRGKVLFALSGKITSTVEATIRVLPFALEEPKDVTFAIDYSRTMSFRPEDGPAELAFFRDLGFNTIWYRGGAANLPQMRRAAAKAGLKVEAATPPRGRLDKYQNWRWPRDYRYANYRRYLARPGVSFQPRHTGHREGRKIRFTHGFWLWRSGIRHRVVQTQPNAAERVYYAHYGHAKFGPCSYLFPSLDGAGKFNPAPTLCEVRDGITDWRYLQTLESLARPKLADVDATTAHLKAQQHLKQLEAAVNPNLDHYYFERKRNFNHVGRFGLHETVWPGRRYQMERWEIARHIAALKGAPLKANGKPAEDDGSGKVILHSEYFGPFWVDESQQRYLKQEPGGTARLLAETPKTPAGRNWATVLVRMNSPAKGRWRAILRDASGKQLAAEDVGALKRWKSRWILRTAHLPAGRYTLEVSPAEGQAEPPGPESKTQIVVLPGID